MLDGLKSMALRLVERLGYSVVGFGALTQERAAAKAILDQVRQECEKWRSIAVGVDQRAGLTESASGPAGARPVNGYQDKQCALLHQRVMELMRQCQPIKINCGCGTRPKPGFLNFDIRFSQPLEDITAEHYIFPFADMAWPIPDNSVDFIFHEDFFEHITQKQQVTLLAEAWRVLKPGAYHRINTPCLAWSMRTHSNFVAGFAGVYTDEWDKWGHKALMIRGILEEMSRIAGYQSITFNQKNQSVSPYRVDEFRPGPDRDSVDGNIFADLRK